LDPFWDAPDYGFFVWDVHLWRDMAVVDCPLVHADQLVGGLEIEHLDLTQILET